MGGTMRRIVKHAMACRVVGMTWLSLLTFSCLASAQTLATSQVAVLIDLQKAWSSKVSGWKKGGNCRKAYGLTCDTKGMITTMTLNSEYVQGSLPASIGNLVELVSLDLGSNAISGQLPASIGNLTKLVLLDMSSNSLSGTLPSTIGSLINLQYLDLQGNQLSGQLPATIGNLNNLIFLNCRSNVFTGPIPSAIGALVSLQFLALQSNFLSGPLPETLASLSFLSTLYLQVNQISGPLPASIGALSNLQTLVLYGNRISGSLPESIGNMLLLTRLDLASNQLSGSIPGSIGNLYSLEYLDLRYSYTLTGSLPSSIGTLTSLSALFLCRNQLYGSLPLSFTNLTSLQTVHLHDNQFSGILPAELAAMTDLQLQASSNFFYGPVPDLSAIQAYDLSDNCFGSDAPQTQRTDEECGAFCGLVPPQPVCGGHGMCNYVNGSGYTCACDSGYVEGEDAFQCVPDGSNTNATVALASSEGVPMVVKGEAIVDKNGTISLCSSRQASGGAFLQQRLLLFQRIVSDPICGRQLAFNASFSFLMYGQHGINGSHGLAFVVTANYLQGGGGCLGYGGIGSHTLAVEFDTYADSRAKDPDGNHVGVNLRGSPISTGAVHAPDALNDGGQKYAWVEYDPMGEGTGTGVLRVYYAAHEVQPDTPVLSMHVDLCAILKPTKQRTFYFGFTAASGYLPQDHRILSWRISTAFVSEVNASSNGTRQAHTFGYDPSAELQSRTGVATSFRYAAVGAASTAAGGSTWVVNTNHAWLSPSFTWPVKNQVACGDSWAYAVVGSIEAAYAILGGLSIAPVLSVDQLRVALNSHCAGGSPLHAFDYLLSISRAGSGLLLDANWNPTSPSPGGPLHPIAAFERISVNSLLLAVQRQPVVVTIEALAPSFLQYDGSYVYSDPECFSHNLNHVVLVVGYLLAGQDPAASRLRPPFWIIRNSWGPEWGDAGHMRMGIESGDGICGINTLPALYPIVKSSTDPCGRRAYSSGLLGPALNPCGSFRCMLAGTSNRCNCTDPHFTEVTAADGANICAYLDACAAAGRNPCGVGSCVNDRKGSYSCVCPPGFVQGSTASGSLSCAPGDANGSYKVQGGNMHCFDILDVFGLTIKQFLDQNPGHPCAPDITPDPPPLPINATLNVTASTNLSACSAFYTAMPGDSCESVVNYFDLQAGCEPEGEPCTLALQALNPGLTCAVAGQLRAYQTLCVERGESTGVPTPLCTRWHAAPSTPCDAGVLPGPASALDLHRLNPGLTCHVPDIPGYSLFGLSEPLVCVETLNGTYSESCPESVQPYVTSAGDTCAFVIAMYFRGNPGCFAQIHNYHCLDPLPVGVIFCRPNPTKFPLGICGV